MLLRRALPAVLAITVNACSDRPSPAEPQHLAISPRIVVNERTPIFYGVVNPCNGEELVSLEGDIHIVISMTEDGDGGFHFGVFNGSHFSGVGATTAAQYTGFYNSNSHFDVRQPFPQVVTAASPGTIVISSGNAPNFLAFFVYHLTINANGEVTGQRNEFRTECRG
jgi:hypothetical protein